LLAAGLICTVRADAADAPAFPPLPVGVSSFGAVACDGYLYVYGGHAGKTHHYDTEAVLGSFQRLKLDGGTKWEQLPAGPRAQGMNLVAHAGKVYRVGGMQPRNRPGEPADNHSLADCARFDPKANAWEPLPPLPAGRSSHDVAVVGDRLVVVGGWQLKGKGTKPAWHDATLLLDLTAREPKWEAIPQPFRRRALTVTVAGSKVYVLGGLGTDGKPNYILDVKARTWATAPALPVAGKRAMAFSPAAATVGGRVVVNTSAGPVYRLSESGASWEKVGEAKTKRVVARLVPFGGDAVILIGGAGGGKNVAALEAIRLAARGEPVAARR
jgi:N-acetylneuraminic acid mutarotase